MDKKKWESNIWQNVASTFWADRPEMLKLIAKLPRLIPEDEFYDALQDVEDWYFPFVKACGDNVSEDQHRRRFVPKLLAARLRESRAFSPEHAAGVNIQHDGIQKLPKKVVEKTPAKEKVVKPAVERPQRIRRSTRVQSPSDR